MFGGLIAAQSLAAAGATVDDGKLPQSLHAYFVRGGRYDADVEFHVDRIRDGRAFATRHVTASQGGAAETIKVGAAQSTTVGGSVDLTGSLVTINGAGCHGAARVGDLVSSTQILTGSSTVCIGG